MQQKNATIPQTIPTVGPATIAPTAIQTIPAMVGTSNIDSNHNVTINPKTNPKIDNIIFFSNIIRNIHTISNQNRTKNNGNNGRKIRQLYAKSSA